MVRDFHPANDVSAPRVSLRTRLLIIRLALTVVPILAGALDLASFAVGLTHLWIIPLGGSAIACGLFVVAHAVRDFARRPALGRRA